MGNKKRTISHVKNDQVFYKHTGGYYEVSKKIKSSGSLSLKEIEQKKSFASKNSGNVSDKIVAEIYKSMFLKKTNKKI